MGVWICQTYLYSCWTEWNLKNRRWDCEIKSYDQSTKCLFFGLMIGREWDLGTLEHLRHLVGDQELCIFLPLILWRAPTITSKPTHAQWKDCAWTHSRTRTLWGSTTKTTCRVTSKVNCWDWWPYWGGTRSDCGSTPDWHRDPGKRIPTRNFPLWNSPAIAAGGAAPPGPIGSWAQSEPGPLSGPRLWPSPWPHPARHGGKGWGRGR